MARLKCVWLVVNVLATVSISTLLVFISNKDNHYRASTLLKRVTTNTTTADIQYSKDDQGYIAKEVLKRVSTADIYKVNTSALKVTSWCEQHVHYYC